MSIKNINDFLKNKFEKNYNIDDLYIGVYGNFSSKVVGTDGNFLFPTKTIETGFSPEKIYIMRELSKEETLKYLKKVYKSENNLPDFHEYDYNSVKYFEAISKNRTIPYLTFNQASKIQTGVTSAIREETIMPLAHLSGNKKYLNGLNLNETLSTEEITKIERDLNRAAFGIKETDLQVNGNIIQFPGTTIENDSNNESTDDLNM